jgi:hypothetical protein
MSDHAGADTLTARVFDYIGMGFLLAPPEVLVLEGIMSTGPVNWTLVVAAFISCYAIGFLILGIGIKWEVIKPKLSSTLVKPITAATNSTWIWLLILAIFASGPVIVVWAFTSHETISHQEGTPTELKIVENQQMKIVRPTSDNYGLLLYYSGTIKQKEQSVKAFIEYTFIHPLLVAQPQRVELGEFNNLAQGENITIPIVSTYGGEKAFRWGSGERQLPSGLYQFAATVRCQVRLVLVGHDGHEQHHDFLLMGSEELNGAITPIVVEDGNKTAIPAAPR